MSKPCLVTGSLVLCAAILSESQLFKSAANETFELACAKAVQKLGMKPVPGIMRVTVKKSGLEAT